MLAPKDGAPALLRSDGATRQPALFALEYALAELWRSWGVVPDAVMGHSVGEFAAAVRRRRPLAGGRAGAHRRARHGSCRRCPRAARWPRCSRTVEQVEPLLAPHREHVSVAAYNGPGQLALSGAAEPLGRIARRRWSRGGSTTHRLNVSHAFHSPLMRADARGAGSAGGGDGAHPRTAAPHLQRDGPPVGANELGAPGYWRRHAREAVRFQAGMESLRGLGIDVFVEVGPHTTLSGLGRACLGEAPRLVLLAAQGPG